MPGEDQAGRDHVVVISDGLWRRLFGGRSDVLGSTLQLNGEPYQVIGVMPPSFHDFYMRQTDVWAPLAFKPEQFADDKRTNEFLRMTARLKAGVSVEQGTRDMAALGEQLKKDYPTQYPPDWTLKTRPLAEEGRQGIRPALLVLLGAVALVLLIACANIANLLLARAAARARELAIRTALGATRGTLVVQMLAESVVLSIAGGALGLLLAYGAIRALVALNPSNIPRVEEIRIDTPVLLFTTIVSLFTGLVFGILPSLHASRANVQAGLREGGRSNVGDSGAIVRRGLVVSRNRARARAARVSGTADSQLLAPAAGGSGLRPAQSGNAEHRAPAGEVRDPRAAVGVLGRGSPQARVGAGRHRCGRHLDDALQRERIDRQLHGRELPAAARAARSLGRHSRRQPAVPPRHEDPPAPWPLLRRRGPRRFTSRRDCGRRDGAAGTGRTPIPSASA